ncbi:ABC transporter C family protein [Phanerochaete sordida]|uniref:ABC transporter C family protein n=1 Tax=Phanerochaete sordida TaxID=48140 RepID=A0A9P3LBY5_9APHY|nr:ABC transporter C family protein [Phanerochaete sordida]
MAPAETSDKASEKDTESIETKDVKDVVPEKGKARDVPRVVLDSGEQHMRVRRRWYQLWLPKNPPPPPPASFDDAPITPLATASILSMLTYTWITPMMTLGYQRTLQATDLWKLSPNQQSGNLGSTLDAHWDRRVKEADEWNRRLDAGEIHPAWYLRIQWFFIALLFWRPGPWKAGAGFGERRTALRQHWLTVSGRKEPSLVWALNDTLGFSFWIGGCFKVFGDTSQLMGPLLVKAIINFSKERAAAKAAGEPIPSMGRGAGMAIGLFLLTVSASVSQHQFFWRSMLTGLLARAALIASIYKRGVNLTGKARTNFPNSALVNHISTDVSRVDSCAQWFHAVWTAPIQIVVCLVILLVELGPSALVGFSLFIVMIPLQQKVMSLQFNLRRKTNIWTDSRAKTLLEVLGAMRVVKYFSYEVPFLKKIYEMRKNELKGIKIIQVARSGNIALAFSIPVLAATLSFVTYTGTAHSFNVAIIFSSFSLFQLLRQPLMFLPRALSATTDAQTAIARLQVLFRAPLMDRAPFDVDPAQKLALAVRDASFEWEESLATKEAKEALAKAKGKRGKGPAPAPVAVPKKEDSPPFQVRNVTMLVPRGSLVAIVGAVGSGKSSLLLGLIGEMRKLGGEVSFGGPVAYCAQTAWIQNATLRENITFGLPFEEDKYWKAVEDSCLIPDLQVLADGDLTEIGEKGINLSGGQKQRVNIARALYHDADVVIFDDPLSAVDAHVGRALFNDAIVGSLRNRGKTVILVTHALHFLSQCDYIYTIDNGTIAAQGKYNDLVENDVTFAKLMKEFGGEDKHEEEVEAEEAAVAQEKVVSIGVEEAKLKSEALERVGAGTGKLEGRLIVAEKRSTGSVSWKVYWAYLQAGRWKLTGPWLLLFAIIMQACQILNSYTLVWWEGNTWHRGNSFYQVLYAGLGIGQAVFTFLLGVAMDEMGAFVSNNLHHDAIKNIFYAPMSFFDTTPTGRILSVFGKDIDNIDNQLPVSMRLLTLTITNLIGSILIITIIEHYFLIAAVFIAIGYQYFASFYRESARELKRLDSMLRSFLYAHFAESLSGLPTIRSYGEIPRFLHDNEYYTDLEDRAAFLTVTNQRWLAIRLDFLGGLMTFVVAMLAVAAVSGINPAQIGLVLTYTTSLTQLCSVVTRQSAEVENYMASVETVTHYSHGNNISQEAPHEVPENKPPAEWPREGAIEFKDIVMRYRPGLPYVLKGLSMSIKGGEKVGVVGRTGAGKSSLMLALFRIVELSGGSITVDGVDISKIGLNDLRTKIAIIPQDPLLFSGTIRSNLDPFNMYDDARLWDALRRSYLIEPTTSNETSDEKDNTKTRFTLDSLIEGEGANLSVGERSLLSLARALVKDSKVVVLDEATASVDLETDSKIQQTIQTQFKDKTLLCIAHRLRTIIAYDRILVLDAGTIAEFDTPLNLFLKEDSIFRGMCERSNISVDEIQKAALRAEEL